MSAVLPVVALVGRPNVGKSSILAAASGSPAETVNAPGTTVGVERRRVRVGDREAWLVDLPGTHSLADEADGIGRFSTLLLDEAPDAVIVVVDAGDLARHLPLALAVRDAGLPLVVAVNLADEAARRGLHVDTGRLAQLLGAPVVTTVGRTGWGVADALALAVTAAVSAQADRAAGRRPVRALPADPYAPATVGPLRAIAERLRDEAAISARSLGAAAFDPAAVLPHVASGRLSPWGAATIEAADMLERARWGVAARWAAEVERREAAPVPAADRLARLVTSPWPGLPLFALVSLAGFGVMLLVGGWLSALLGEAWSTVVSPPLTAALDAAVPLPALAAALGWALDGGLLAMLSVGIPYVLVFYVLLAVLEDSGYLASAAVLSDRLFGILGLPGRAAIPILAAAGCNVPAVQATRVLATRRERVLASLLVTLTPCSARSAVVIAALAPFAGPHVALAAFGVTVGIAVAAGTAANALIPGRQSPLVLELAPLRRPSARLVARRAWVRFRSFVVTATPFMLAGSFVLGLLWESGSVAVLTTAADPLMRGWLGLPGFAGIALVFAFLRKELALQLLVVLAVAEIGAGAASLGAWLSPGQLFVYAVVTAVSVPCVATLATLSAELGRRAAAGITLATLGLALAAGGILARLLGVA